MSLCSTLSQKRLGKGNDSRDGGVVVRDGAAGGLGGLLPTLVPVVFMVVVRPLCCAVVVVTAVVVIRGGAGTEVASEIGGAERQISWFAFFLISYRVMQFPVRENVRFRIELLNESNMETFLSFFLLFSPFLYDLHFIPTT